MLSVRKETPWLLSWVPPEVNCGFVALYEVDILTVRGGVERRRKLWWLITVVSDGVLSLYV